MSTLAGGERFAKALSGHSAYHTLALAATPPVTAPTVATNAANGVTTSGATLNGTVNDEGASTTVTFQYGLTTSYGSTVTAAQSPVSGWSDTVVSAAISGLTAGTTYHFRAVGVNSVGTTNGSDATFTTPIGSVPASFTSATDVPLTMSNVTITSGSAATLALGYAPTAGTNLTVVNNTGLGFISGTFSNLVQGQVVSLSYGGGTYEFVANYYGGSANDLVLVWKNSRPLAWGYNPNGQLGDGTTTQRNVPTAVITTGVLAGKTIVAVAGGGNHSLMLCSDGTLAAWGGNNGGELGINSTTGSSVPVTVNTSGVLSGKTVVAVAAGGFHSLALCSDGTVAAWGNNTEGQVGDNGLTYSLVPVAVNTSGVLSGKTVVAVAAGYLHSMALCSDGTVAAWGSNSAGQLGNNTTTQSSVPVAVNTSGSLSGKTVVGVAAGQYHSLALCSDSTVAAWGDNLHGQLGNNSPTDSLVPVAVNTSEVLSGKTVVAVAGAQLHSIALCSDGTVAAWGYNGNGQLGNGSTTDSLVPVAVNTSGVLSGKTVVAVTAGQVHSMALCSDGTVAAWGYNDQGQLGIPSITHSNVPVAVDTSALSAGERFTKAIAASTGYHNLAFAAMPNVPEIAVEQPAGTGLTDGSASLSFATTAVGSSSPSLTFVIRNSGNAGLTGLAITKDGANAADFSVGSLGSTTVAQDGSTTFTVTFSPTALGSRSAAIHIASDDADENPFDITLSGTATAPEIAVEQPVGTSLTNGSGTISFGTVVGGTSSAVKTFTLKNLGNADLTGLVITQDGTNAADYTVSTTGMTTTVAPSASTTFTVTFTPAAAATTGARAAVLHIASNDADENPFDIALSGTGLSQTYDTDSDGLNDAAEFQLATLGFDWQTAQTALVTTLTSNANTANLFSQTQVDASRQGGRDDVTSAPNSYSLYTQSQFQALSVGVPLLQKDGATGQFKLTIGVQKSADLMHFDAFPVTAPQTTINAQGQMEIQFTVPDSAAFFRLQSQ